MSVGLDHVLGPLLQHVQVDSQRLHLVGVIVVADSGVGAERWNLTCK